MNVIELAREAGLIRSLWVSDYEQDYLDGLERFAALIRAEERERCAAVADEHATRKFPWASENSDKYHAQADWAERIAAAIRGMK